jgi:hypothetical protein
MAEDLTPKEASKMLKKRMDELGLDNPVTAKTISFQDLAGTSEIFVIVHDWKPNPLAKKLKEFAEQHNFFVDFVPAKHEKAFAEVM